MAQQVHLAILLQFYTMYIWLVIQLWYRTTKHIETYS